MQGLLELKSGKKVELLQSRFVSGVDGAGYGGDWCFVACRKHLRFD